MNSRTKFSLLSFQTLSRPDIEKRNREKLIQDTLEFGSRINDLSIKTGLAAETLSGLDSQAKESGTSIEVLGKGVFILQKNVESGSPKVRALAESFGITKDNV